MKGSEILESCWDEVNILSSLSEYGVQEKRRDDSQILARAPERLELLFIYQEVEVCSGIQLGANQKLDLLRIKVLNF